MRPRQLARVLHGKVAECLGHHVKARLQAVSGQRLEGRTYALAPHLTPPRQRSEGWTAATSTGLEGLKGAVNQHWKKVPSPRGERKAPIQTKL